MYFGVLNKIPLSYGVLEEKEVGNDWYRRSWIKYLNRMASDKNEVRSKL
jgi:hypothetical protein